MSCTTCPVYHPTLKDFSNFSKYIQFIEKDVDLEKVGLVKIVPPKGWYEKICNLEEMQDFHIQRPVAQLVSRVGSGTYTVNLLEKPDISVEKFALFAENNKIPKGEMTYDEIERKFWRSVGLNGGLDDPMYGADMVGSLFGSAHASSWNVNHLDTPLKIIGHNLPGVSNSMLYFGCWRAMFAFHTEDMELYSINYLHYGAPKSWYSVPPKFKKRFEVMAQSYFPEEYYHCSEFLRHKTSLISPTRLKDGAIPYHTAVQEVGEFIITFPGSYHQGYNHGFNIAEATNFATERWIDVARNARVCHCQPDSVQIDMDIFETLYYRDKMRNKLKEQQQQQQQQEQTKTTHSALSAASSSALSSSSCCLNSSDGLVDLTKDRSSSPSSQESQSDHSSLNTNNNEETQWLLRCKCGKRVWYPLIPTPDGSNPMIKHEIHDLNFAHLLVVAEGDIFQCVDCGLWSHIECVYGTDCNESNISENPKCHMCSNFDILCVQDQQQDEEGEDDEEGVVCAGRKEGRGKRKLSSAQSEYQISVSTTPIASQDTTDSNGNSSQEEERIIKVEKKIPKKFRPQLHDVITAAVYSKKNLRYENVTGEIVAIEGSNIRIHVKGTKRSADPWIDLLEYNFTNDIVLNSSRSTSSSLSSVPLSSLSSSSCPETKKQPNKNQNTKKVKRDEFIQEEISQREVEQDEQEEINDGEQEKRKVKSDKEKTIKAKGKVNTKAQEAKKKTQTESSSNSAHQKKKRKTAQEVKDKTKELEEARTVTRNHCLLNADSNSISASMKDEVKENQDDEDEEEVWETLPPEYDVIVLSD